MKATAEEFIARKTLDWENERRDGKALRMKDVGREAWHYWVRDAGTLHAQADGYPCIFSVERLRYVKTEGTPRFPYGPLDHIEYRLGYYTIARNGHWWWGQYAQIIPAPDLKQLFTKALEEGTILPEDFPLPQTLRA